MKKKITSLKSEKKSETDKANPQKVVAIGASAGGLNAIQTLFDSISETTGYAFIIVQHLSSDYKSLMPELLAKHTNMKIYTAQDKQKIEPNCIYLNQNAKNLKIKGDQLFLIDKDPTVNLDLPIDLFFHSLGEAYGVDSVGIILSGTGLDGSRGLRTIKEKGGLILVQSPESSQFDGMPNSAIASGMVDFIMNPSEIGKTLQSYSGSKVALLSINESYDELFSKILKEIQRYSGVDFRRYKQNTLIRRLEKRVNIHSLGSLNEYYELITTDEKEIDNLYHDFLINVTSFFRDREAFAHLNKTIFPKLTYKKEGVIRIWVPGCSTGEEAYSLAVALENYILTHELYLDFKIFATDVSISALNKASSGTYPATAIGDLESKYLSQFFIKTGDHIQISKKIRDKIVFSKNDILKDPPFIRMDLISCRNLLIYLENNAQDQVIQNFQFSLNEGGFLFLGSSESLGANHESNFKVLHSKWKLFEMKNSNRAFPNRNLDVHPQFQAKNDKIHLKRPLLSSHEAPFYKYLSDQFSPSVIFLDRDYNIQFVKGDAGKKLTPKEGVFHQNILQMVDSSVAAIIRNGIRRLKTSNKPVIAKEVNLSGKGDEVFDITIYRAKVTESEEDYYAIAFSEDRKSETPENLADEASIDATTQRIEDLEYELKVKNDELRTLIEELETSNEELQSSNEELMASNEELQSTNEELQSVNEELYTVNSELQQKNKEVQSIYNDLSNLYASQDIATLFLDIDLKIRYFTPSIKDHLELAESDLGRSLHNFMFFDVQTRKVLLEETQKTLETSKKFEREIIENNRNYLLRILPFLSENKVDGVVISLIDTHELVSAKTELEKAELQYKMLFDNMQAGFMHGKIITDKKGKPIDWEYIKINEAFAAQTGLGMDVTGKRVTDLVPNIEKETQDFIGQIGKVALEGGSIHLNNYLSGLDRHFDAHIFSLGNREFASIFTDISAIKKINEALEREKKLATTLTDSSIAGTYIFDIQKKKYTYANNRTYDILGFKPAELEKMTSKQLLSKFHEEDLPDILEHLKLVEKANRPIKHAYRFRHKNGYYVNCLGLDAPYEYDENNKLKTCIGTFIDISELSLKEKELTLAKNEAILANKQKDLFLANLSHEIRTPLNGVLGFSRLLNSENLDQSEKEKFIAQIEQNSHLLTSLINDILLLTKIDSREFKVNFSPVNIDTLFTQIIGNHEIQLRENENKKALSLKFRPVKGGEDTIMQTDSLRLTQILNNLLTNAVKFSTKGTIELGYEVIQRSGKIDIWVKDEGVGIKKADQEIIFDRYSQLEENLSSQMGGIGLGLAITKSIVKAMDGEISLTSKYRQGSTFTVRLPFNLGETQKPQKRPKTKKIIIADDNPSIHFYYESLLKTSNKTLLKAYNGEEVLDLLRKHKDVDLIMMDMRMPVMDGPTTLLNLREFNKEVRVVGQTAFALKEQLLKFKKMGFEEIITKPIEPQKLNELIH